MKKLHILGTGCAKCRLLAEHTEQAARALGIDYELVKVTALTDIAAFGPVMTPALVVDGEIRSAGRVPSVEAIKPLLV